MVSLRPWQLPAKVAMPSHGDLEHAIDILSKGAKTTQFYIVILPWSNKNPTKSPDLANCLVRASPDNNDC